MLARQFRKAFSSVDPQEMKVFSQVQDWWNPNGSMRALHAYNSKRVRYIRKTVPIPPINTALPLHKMNILDVGCGGGLLSESMARLGGSVTGLDANANSIQIAKSHLQLDPQLENNLTYMNCSSENLTPSPTYEIITAMEVIEHVNDPVEFVQSLSALLKPNGLLFLSTINQSALGYLYTIAIAEYLTRIVPVGTHHYHKYITPNNLQLLCQSAGLTQLSTQGVFYDPVMNRMLETSNLQTNYMAAYLKQE